MEDAAAAADDGPPTSLILISMHFALKTSHCRSQPCFDRTLAFSQQADGPPVQHLDACRSDRENAHRRFGVPSASIRTNCKGMSVHINGIVRTIDTDRQEDLSCAGQPLGSMRWRRMDIDRYIERERVRDGHAEIKRDGDGDAEMEREGE